MRSLLFCSVRKFFICGAAIIAAAFSVQARAVLIDFDDLTYIPENPEHPSFGEFPLDTQYQAQGLLINNAFLLPYAEGDDSISGTNYLLAGASGSSMTLSFIGKLPTYVGMYIGGRPAGVLYTMAYGPSGIFASHEKEEGGWEYVSFESNTGIARIEMFASQQHRVSGAKIEDITFTYASVPEPSSLMLAVLAIIISYLRRVYG